MTPRPHGSVMGDVRLKAATELRLLAKATDETGFARVGPPSLERIADELEAASQSPESAAPVGGTGVRLTDEEAIGVMAGAIKGRYPRARMDAEELREDCRVAYAALRAASAGGPE